MQTHGAVADCVLTAKVLHAGGYFALTNPAMAKWLLELGNVVRAGPPNSRCALHIYIHIYMYMVAPQ